MPGLFDYACCADRSAAFDIFLCAQARFYWGTSSGPVSVAAAFGTPIAGSNWIPASMPPPNNNCLFLPKRLWLKVPGRWASLAEILEEPFYNAQDTLIYDKAGAEVIDNTADEIRGLVMERLASLDASQVDLRRKTARQRKVHFIYQTAGLVLNSNLAAASLIPLDGQV